MEKRDKTIGRMLLETQKKHEQEQIEVGEFIDTLGSKEIMKEIWKQIDARRTLPEWKAKFYLLVLFKKNYQLQRVVEIYVQSRHTKPKAQPGLSLFSYDPPNDRLALEWTLPDTRAFNTFLSHKDDFDPFLIECIEKYKKGIL
jgi:hypothetical protein